MEIIRPTEINKENEDLKVAMAIVELLKSKSTQKEWYETYQLLMATLQSQLTHQPDIYPKEDE